MAFDRRQAKSFGEPTRVRMDGTRAEPKDEDLPRAPRPSTAYESYKQQLHAFFSGQKPLPDHLKELLATRPGASQHMEGVSDDAPLAEDKKAPAKKGGKTTAKRAGAKDEGERQARRVVASNSDDFASLVEAIRKATSPREVEGAIDQLKQRGHTLPGDPEVLSKALGHSREEIHAEALRGIKHAIEGGTMKPSTLLKTRVHNVALLASSSEVKDLCGELKRLIG